MSVTFSIDSVGTGKYEFICYTDGDRNTYGPFDSREIANEKSLAHVEECRECSIYRPFVNEIQDVNFDMNVSNSNAGMLLRVLGMEVDWCGSMDADNFLGHVLVSLGMPLDDSGIRPSEYQAMGENGQPVGPRIIDCGVSEGYITKRLTTLAEMAAEAKRIGRQITWG
jgi:hypothetical protein